MPVRVDPIGQALANVTQRIFNGGDLDFDMTISGAQSNAETAIDMSTFNVHAWNAETARVWPDGQGPYVLPQTVQTFSPDDIQAAPLPSDYPRTISHRRLIGMGFESVNTTSELYKQGTVTAYRVPSRTTRAAEPIVRGNLFQGYTPVTPPIIFNVPLTAMPVDVMAGAAGSVREAMTYAGTKQWPAAEGSYSVVTYDASDNPIHSDVLGYVAFMNNSAVQLGPAGTPSGFGIVTHTYDFETDILLEQRPQWHHPLPADISGVILSGLSLQTTLTINVVFTVEIAAHLYDPTYGAYVYTSRPSAAYEPEALRYYAAMAKLMPAGVMQKLNPFGEFWNWIVGAVKKAAPYVSLAAGVIDHPVAQLVSRVAQLAGDMANLKRNNGGGAGPAMSTATTVASRKSAKARAASAAVLRNSSTRSANL